jgi:ASC-1-like (ASCH) protein
MTHHLKIETKYFREIEEGIKTFEVRKNDRDYREGDCVILQEMDGIVPTGWNLCIHIRYILKGPIHGIEKGYIIFNW